MILITKRPHGFIIRLEGLLEMDAVQILAHQLRDEWAGLEDSFVLVLDARTFKCFAADAQALFEELLEEGLSCGMVRLTVLAISTALANMFCSMMVRTEVMPIYQFLDLAYEEDFRREMEKWLNEPFLKQSIT